MTSGVYRITNKKTGQIYIGQSSNIERRIRQHCNMTSIDFDIAKYGKDNFVFDILEEVDDDLHEREKFWIEHYGTYKNEYHYNLTSGGHSTEILKPSKYTLWNPSVCMYQKGCMYKNGREPDLCRCFVAMYKLYRLPIGTFNEFLSCEIIINLIDNYINE